MSAKVIDMFEIMWSPNLQLDVSHFTFVQVCAAVNTPPPFCGPDRCNRLRCPLARMSGLQCFNMGHNGHGINLYGVSMTLMGN